MKFRNIRDWYWGRIIYAVAIVGILTWFALTPKQRGGIMGYMFAGAATMVVGIIIGASLMQVKNKE